MSPRNEVSTTSLEGIKHVSIEEIPGIQFNVPFIAALPLLLIIPLHTSLSKSVKHLLFSNISDSYHIPSLSSSDYFIEEKLGMAYSQDNLPHFFGCWSWIPSSMPLSV